MLIELISFIITRVCFFNFIYLLKMLYLSKTREIFFSHYQIADKFPNGRSQPAIAQPVLAVAFLLSAMLLLLLNA